MINDELIKAKLLSTSRKKYKIILTKYAEIINDPSLTAKDKLDYIAEDLKLTVEEKTSLNYESFGAFLSREAPIRNKTIKSEFLTSDKEINNLEFKSDKISETKPSLFPEKPKQQKNGLEPIN